jgi:hypothetical protein
MQWAQSEHKDGTTMPTSIGGDLRGRGAAQRQQTKVHLLNQSAGIV